MSTWPKYPFIYEINTWVWLAGLSTTLRRTIDLSSVPSGEWDKIANLGFDAVWLMGVWERSPAGIAIANQNSNLLNDFRRALQDFQPKDNVGSPYCVRRYVVDRVLGGPEGLAVARQELAKRGVRLILDWVPNHVAPDHPWASDHPEYFISGTEDDLRRDPSSYVAISGSIFACGRDPYFPAWPDVLQLNAFQSGLRKAVAETVKSIADQCDGVRCDMAMLVLNNIFQRTWGAKAGAMPGTEYWQELIPPTKAVHPDFIFIAEAYWDLEWELQQKGFDFCYDKRLYDRVVHENAASVRGHLNADLSYQGKLLRFIENHDEPRAAAEFIPGKDRVAAVLTATLPGARLFYDGQFEGRKVRLPVFLSRLPEEPVNRNLQEFYEKLLTNLRGPLLRDGDWRLCQCSGWPDNPSYQNLLAWCWEKGDERCLIVVNLSEGTVQGRVQVPWSDLANLQWALSDPLSGTEYARDGSEIFNPGLYVELGGWGYNCFIVQRPGSKRQFNADLSRETSITGRTGKTAAA